MNDCQCLHCFASNLSLWISVITDLVGCSTTWSMTDGYNFILHFEFSCKTFTGNNWKPPTACFEIHGSSHQRNYCHQHTHTHMHAHTHTHTPDHSCPWSHPLRLTLRWLCCEVLAKERADLVCVDMAPLSALDAADVAHLDSKGLVTNGVITFGIPVKHDRRHSPTGPHHPICWDLSLSNPQIWPPSEATGITIIGIFFSLARMLELTLAQLSFSWPDYFQLQ